MNFQPKLNPQVFLNAANLMVEWRDSNPSVDKLSDYYNGWQTTYNSHCCLRAIHKANNIPGYLVHYHRSFFSYCFKPAGLPDDKPFWKDNYEARIIALCLAAEIC